MNVFSDESVDEVVQNLRDMFFPMEDIEYAIDYLHEHEELQDDDHDEILKKLCVECETIQTSLLDCILRLWKKTTDQNKDILKEYYNKFRRLNFQDEYFIQPFHMDLIHNLNQSVKTIDALRSFIVIIIYSLEETHKLLKKCKVAEDLIPWSFRSPLKKMESCIISVIFILKMNTEIEYELFILESLHSSISE